MKIIAHIKSDFPEKFGIPRQSGLTNLFRKLFSSPNTATRRLAYWYHIVFTSFCRLSVIKLAMT